MSYKITVILPECYPETHEAVGHALTNAQTRVKGFDRDKRPIYETVYDGPYRLEIQLADGRFVIYCDCSKLVVELSKEWFDQHGQAGENGGGGVVKLADQK